MAEQQKSRFKLANPSDPDSFKGGSATNFDGIVVSVYAYPYVGRESSTGKYNGFVGVRILPDPESGFDEFTKKYIGFYLNSGVPSKDGETAAGDTEDMYRMFSNGKARLDDDRGPCVDEQGHVKPDHPNVGEFLLGKFTPDGAVHQLFDAFADCDEKGAFIDKNIASLNKKYSGLKCHFDLVAPRPRKGAKAESEKGDGKEKEKENEDRLVLVPTKIYSKGNKVSGTSAGTGTSSGASSSPANGSGGLDALEPVITAEVLEQLKAAPGNTMPIGDLMVKVPKALIAKQAITKGQKALVQAWIGERTENPDGSPGLPVNLIDLDGADWDPDLYDKQGGLELS